MTDDTIARLRLQRQHLTDTPFETAAQVVQWLGAVQAQDYQGALWALALRIKDATKAHIEQAIAHKTIIRTWPMRGTLHFITPEDIRWMLPLLTPRIIARSAPRYRQLELTDTMFERSKELITAALQGNKQLTRNELYSVLEQAHISTSGTRGLHILGHLAQQGLICFSAHKGKQPSFALLDEWVPMKGNPLEEQGALAELARRYFASHGPATLQDFEWWTGLTKTQARAGLEMVKSEFIQENAGGQIYWFSPDTLMLKTDLPLAHLLPMYDEYTVAYKDRRAVLDAADAKLAGNGIFSPVVVVDGRIVGTWRRTLKKDKVMIYLSLFRTLTEAQHQAVISAANRYATFLDIPSGNCLISI